VVTSTQNGDALAVIRQQCLELSSPLYCYGEHFGAAWKENGLEYNGLRSKLSGLTPGIAGRYQSANAACALAAAELLDGTAFTLPEAALRSGIETAYWPGRMEILGDAPRFLLDGAHNPAGGLALADSLRDIPYERLFLVAGVMLDKDAEGILAPLFPLVEKVFAVSPRLERALPSARLAEYCRIRGVTCDDAGTVAAGLAQAKSAAGTKDLILVCGSLFTVGEARATLSDAIYEPFRG
jgi:dihydrofolate synthase/folylpolyglutamate synthase